MANQIVISLTALSQPARTVVANRIDVVAVVTTNEMLYIKFQKTQRPQIGNPYKITERMRQNILRSSTVFMWMHFARQIGYMEYQ